MAAGRVRKHTCADCPKTFHNKSDLADHRFNHHADPNAKVYQCPHCPWNSPRKGNFTRHMVDVHKTGPQWVCKVCRGKRDGSRGRSDNVKRHVVACMREAGLTGNVNDWAVKVPRASVDGVAADAAATTTTTTTASPAPAPAPVDNALELDQFIQNNEPTGYGPASTVEEQQNFIDPSILTISPEDMPLSEEDMNLYNALQGYQQAVEAIPDFTLESDTNSTTPAAAAAEELIQMTEAEIESFVAFLAQQEPEEQEQQQQQQQQQHDVLVREDVVADACGAAGQGELDDQMNPGQGWRSVSQPGEQAVPGYSGDFMHPHDWAHFNQGYELQQQQLEQAQQQFVDPRLLSSTPVSQPMGDIFFAGASGQETLPQMGDSIFFADESLF